MRRSPQANYRHSRGFDTPPNQTGYEVLPVVFAVPILLSPRGTLIVEEYLHSTSYHLTPVYIHQLLQLGIIESA